MDILELRKVNKRFGGVHAIKELDLTVTQGTVHGLIGPNGSGKTTTFNVISGVFPPTDGQIFFGGRDITARLRDRPPGHQPHLPDPQGHGAHERTG